MKGKDRNRLRDKLGLLSSYLRASDPEFGSSAPVDSQGRRVFVSCLVDDSVHDAVRIVHQMGDAALVMAFDMNGKSLSVTAGQVTISESHTDGDCSLPVGPGCTLADLFNILTPGASMTLQLAGDSLLIDKFDEQPVDRKAADLAGV